MNKLYPGQLVYSEEKTKVIREYSIDGIAVIEFVGNPPKFLYKETKGYKRQLDEFDLYYIPDEGKL